MATEKTVKPYIAKGFELPTGRPGAEKFIHLEIINYDFVTDDNGVPQRKDLKSTQAFAPETLAQFVANHKAAGATTIRTLYDPSGEDTVKKLFRLEWQKELKQLEKEVPSVASKKRIAKLKELLDKK